MSRLRSTVAFALVQSGARDPWICGSSTSYLRGGVISEVCSWWDSLPDETKAQKWQRLRKEHGYRIVKVRITPIGRPR